MAVRRVGLAVLFDLAEQQVEKIHHLQQGIGQQLGIGLLAIAHPYHQVFAGVQHQGHFGKVEQPAVALHGVYQAEQLGQQFVVGGLAFQRHQQLADALQAVAAFIQELRQYRVHAFRLPATDGHGPAAAAAGSV